MDYKKQIFAAVLGASLILPSYVFAVATGDQTTGGPPATTITGAAAKAKCTSLLGTLGITPCELVPTENPLGTARDIANSIAWKVAKLLVYNLTQQIVNLIRTGGQGGGPLFVQNWQDFLLDSADQASGVFLEELKLTQLCQPFAPRLRLIFGQGRQSLQQRYACTLSSVLGNVQSFFNDFRNGGWERWMEFTMAANNPYTSFLDLAAEKEQRSASAANASLNEALSGNGFLGIDECTPQHIFDAETEEDHIVGQHCIKVSPGKWLEDRLSASTNSDLAQLNLADSFDEIILASFQTLMQNLFFQQGGLSSSNISSVSVTQDLASLQADGLKISGISSAILTTSNIIAIKQSSLAKTQDLFATLQGLRSCKTTKNEPLADVDNRIATASSTMQALNGDIVDQTIFSETLKDDQQAMLLAQNVSEFQQTLAKTQADALTTGSAPAAQTENDMISAEKTQAEADLQLCLNPPPPTSQ